MIDPALGTSDKTPKRRAIDDGSTSLLPHLLQFELHATPYTAEIDPHHPVVIFSGSISSLCEDILNTGIVVGRIDASEGGDRLFHHCFHLRVLAHVTAVGQSLITFIGKLLSPGLRGFLIPIRQHHGGTAFSETPCDRKTHSRAATLNK